MAIGTQGVGTTRDASDLVIPIPPTRYETMPGDPSSAPPPYSSLFDDVLIQGTIFKRTDVIRQAAESPLLPRLGQEDPANGWLGRFATPDTIPEARGGAIVSNFI